MSDHFGRSPNLRSQLEHFQSPKEYFRFIKDRLRMDTMVGAMNEQKGQNTGLSELVLNWVRFDLNGKNLETF